jgi:hypothetical protein
VVAQRQITTGTIEVVAGGGGDKRQLFFCLSDETNPIVDGLLSRILYFEARGTTRTTKATSNCNPLGGC